MRLFVAAALPESWKAALDRAARALADQGVRGNFTRRENYHLTLVFLGETDRLDDVIAAMDTVDAPLEVHFIDVGQAHLRRGKVPPFQRGYPMGGRTGRARPH